MTSPPDLLLLRHGETEWNRSGRLQGSLDSPLTERGRAQARAQGRLLAGLGVGPGTHLVLTSPQGRAVATARLALDPLGVVARPDPRLVEIGMGGWTGLTRAEVDRRWPGQADEPLLGFYARCPGGETLAAVAARVAPLLLAIDQPAVLVTHRITAQVLSALALGLRPDASGHLEPPQGAVVRIAGGRHEVVGDAAGLPGPAVPTNPSPAGG